MSLPSLDKLDEIMSNLEKDIELNALQEKMEQMKEKKRQKKPISIVKTMTVVTNYYENKDDVNLEALEDEELGMVNAIRFQ